MELVGDQETCDTQIERPQATENIDLRDFNDDDDKPQTLQNSSIQQINSYYICHKTSRIAINTAQGFAIVQDNKIKKYFENSPFSENKKENGVKLSCLLANQNLIALVPTNQKDKDTGKSKTKTINSEQFNLLQLRSSSVYIYDMNINSIIFIKDFNQQIQNLHFNQTHIIVGNKNRIIAYNYIQGKNKPAELINLLELYEDKNARLPIKYFETRYITGNPQAFNKCGKIKASIQQPQVIVYALAERNKLGIFKTQLDYEYKLDVQPFEDFAISPDGKYIGLSGVGGNNIQIIDLHTRKIWTQFRRGMQSKKSLCLNFFNGWFGIIYDSKKYATLHLFEMKQKKQNQKITSKFKRYFSTYSSNVDLMIQNNKLNVISFIGGYLEAINMDKVNDHYGEFVKSIKPNQIQMWSPI